MLTDIVESVVFVTLLASGTDLGCAVAGITSILLVITLKVTVKTTGLIVVRPGNQWMNMTHVTGGIVGAVLASWRAFLTVVIVISEESNTTRSTVIGSNNTSGIVYVIISIKA